MAVWRAYDYKELVNRDKTSLDCRQQGLGASDFGYWVRKLRQGEQAPAHARSGGFVPVAVASPPACGLTLALPSGLEIRGIGSDKLGLVRQLLDCVS